MNIQAIVYFYSIGNGGRQPFIVTGYQPILLLDESQASECVITLPDTPLILSGATHSAVGITILRPQMVPEIDVDREFGLFDGEYQIGVGRVISISEIH